MRLSPFISNGFVDIANLKDDNLLAVEGLPAQNHLQGGEVDVGETLGLEGNFSLIFRGARQAQLSEQARMI